MATSHINSIAVQKTKNLEFWMWGIIFLYQYTSYMRTLMMGFLSSIDSKLIKIWPNLNLKIFAIHLVIVHPYEAISLVFDSGSIVSISTNSLMVVSTIVDDLFVTRKCWDFWIILYNWNGLQLFGIHCWLVYI